MTKVARRERRSESDRHLKRPDSYTVVPRHTSAPTYEFFEIRADEQVIFLLLVTSEIRDTSPVRFVSNTQSRHHDQLAACFRCDKLCSCVRVLCCVYIYSCSSFIFITMDRKNTEVMQEIGFEESEEEVISTSEIKEILGMWESVSQFVEKNTQKKLQQVVHLTFLMTLA
ncbi:hypothetical protein CDAR_223131 [Caerostris darwini]|uniref:Uncharacterized protein n=1 Tax=Caerostris darwini TaxID=1538125 RepID=A0AAV4SQT2_9ARAC|nr:hypothetical protein CDAR_223131 [Caerostris darwini]